MEYAAGGELFERICNAGRFGEDEVYSYNHLFFFLIFHMLKVVLIEFHFF